MGLSAASTALKAVISVEREEAAESFGADVLVLLLYRFAVNFFSHSLFKRDTLKSSSS
jgi:hypothetical protein